jgi:hypothetical protein
MPKILKQIHSYYQVEGIYNMLSTFSANGRPIDYKIQVDGMDVVPRTNDIGSFYLHRDMISETSRSMEIFVFKGRSLRCERYQFIFEDYWYEETNTVSCEKVEEMVQKALAEEKDKYEREQLQMDNERLKGDNEKLKDHCEKLNRVIEELEKEKKEKDKDVPMQIMQTIERFVGPHLDKLLPQAAESIEKKERALDAANDATPVVPIGEGSELVEYLRKEFSKTNLTRQDMNDILFAYHFRAAFADELARIDKILATLSLDKSKIGEIEKLLYNGSYSTE